MFNIRFLNRVKKQSRHMPSSNRLEMALYLFNSNEVTNQVDWDYGSYVQGEILAAIYAALKPDGGWSKLSTLNACHGDLFYENIQGQPVGMTKLTEWITDGKDGIRLTTADSLFEQSIRDRHHPPLPYVPYAVGLWPISDTYGGDTYKNLLTANSIGCLGLIETGGDIDNPKLLDDLCLVGGLKIEDSKPYGWRLSHKDLVRAGFIENNPDVDQLVVESLFNAYEDGDIARVHEMVCSIKGLVKSRESTDGRTLLHEAVDRGDTQTVDLLLSLGADPGDAASTDGWTPLHSCAYYEMTQLAERLIAAGANVNAQKTDDGLTPLHVAALKGASDVMKVLLSNGADKTVRDKKGRTVADYGYSTG